NKNFKERGGLAVSENQNKSCKGFIMGAIVGGIVGAVTALLLAPKSGKEMREDLNAQAEVLKERTLQLKDSAVEKGSEWISLAKEKSTELAKTVNKQSQQVVEKVKDFTQNIKTSNAQDESPLINDNPFLEQESTND